MINPSLHINKVFREQVENFLKSTFHENIMEPIRGVMKNNDTYVIALIIFMRIKEQNQKNFIVTICVLYSLV